MTNGDADLGAPDFEALRARYRQERDRRAPSGPQDRRFHDIEQGFSHLLAPTVLRPSVRRWTMTSMC
jgi:hypothetical protein